MSRKILPSDLEITHVRGSGPGGQNRNKRMSGVRIVHLPTGIITTATERRSQAQNLSAAMERLVGKLVLHDYRPPPRFATKKTRASQEKRVENKKKKSQIKNLRREKSKSWDD